MDGIPADLETDFHGYPSDQCQTDVVARQETLGEALKRELSPAVGESEDSGRKRRCNRACSVTVENSFPASTPMLRKDSGNSSHSTSTMLLTPTLASYALPASSLSVVPTASEAIALYCHIGHGVNSKGKAVKWYTCTFCSTYKGSDHRDNAEAHIFAHVGLTPYSCDTW